ncbi:MAG TPA: uracil-DNA glycosylase [Gemmatimonadaceae bacterium]|nr:uracil-DNA glycosylase [Gemmatimonadaceae bacterium]
MDAKERLRLYLLQRREVGESELVLDGMTVDEVMRLIGAVRGRAGDLPVREARVVRDADMQSGPRGAVNDAPSDWREALRAAGGGPRADEQTAPPRRVPDAPRTVRVDTPVAPRGPDESPPPAEGAPIPAAEPRAPAASVPPDAPTPVAAGSGLVVGGSETELFGGPMAGVTTLAAISEAVAGCTRCRLYATATRGVPGEGNPNAELVCVGEAPGASEDATGRPFVGDAGQLLTKILAAINLRREDVFICNVIKHRPPGNRNPAPDEVAACSPYLVRQLELIRPKVIVALGTFAAQTLLNTKTPIGKLRGLVHRYHGIPLVATYHPAALLRNPSWKRPTWEDVQLARRILDSARGA